jgi:hypothetical protein
MWRRRSPPQTGGEVQSYRTCGGAGAHLCREARSRAIGHVAAPEPMPAGGQGLELHIMWQHVDACPATCLVMKPICGGTWSTGYRQWPMGPPRERL